MGTHHRTKLQFQIFHASTNNWKVETPVCSAHHIIFVIILFLALVHFYVTSTKHFLKDDKLRQICRVLTKSHVALIMWIEHKANRRSEIFPFTNSRWIRPRGHSVVKNTGRGADSIVWGLGFWLGKYILGFFKNIDSDKSQGVAKMIHMDN